MSLKVNRTDHETEKALSHTVQSLFLVAFAFLTRKNASMSKRWTGVANASAHGSPDKEEWFCGLQHHNSIRIRRRGAVENVDCTIYPSTRGRNWRAKLCPTSSSSKCTGRNSSSVPSQRCIYSSSANSARPCFEFRYSFLDRSADKATMAAPAATHLSIAHCMVAYPRTSGGMK
jgi:hypothetical protein